MFGGALHLVLDLTRAEEAGDPYAFRFGTQEYLLPSAGGGVEAATFEWDQALLDDLEALRAQRPNPAAVERVGGRLSAFLNLPGWAKREEIADAVKAGERVIVTFRSNAAELYSLPWELLKVGSKGQRLGTMERVLLWYAWSRIKADVERPLTACLGGEARTYLPRRPPHPIDVCMDSRELSRRRRELSSTARGTPGSPA